MRRIIPLVVLIAFIFSCGGHWLLFQCMAWGNMIRIYSEMAPFSQAVGMTFSGQYPCKMCKAIVEKEKQERQKDCKLSLFKKDVTLAVFSVLPMPAFVPMHWEVPDLFHEVRLDSPPTPPPRFS